MQEYVLLLPFYFTIPYMQATLKTNGSDALRPTNCVLGTFRIMSGIGGSKLLVPWG